jgi:ribonuclease P protein component
MPGIYAYNKTEKLKSRKTLNGLFTGGKSFSVFPVKLFYQLAEAETNPVKAGVGVSARNFSKAVDRNRIKRLLRECYRLHKTPLHHTLEQKQKTMAVFFLYTGKEMPDYQLLDEKMKTALTKLEEIIARA